MPNFRLVLQAPLVKAMLDLGHRHHQPQYSPIPRLMLHGPDSLEACLLVAERQEKSPHRWELSETDTIYWLRRLTHEGMWGAYPCSFSYTHTSQFGCLQ